MPPKLKLSLQPTTARPPSWWFALMSGKPFELISKPEKSHDLLKMTYRAKLEYRIAASNSNLCVGLDPRPDIIEGDIGDFLIRVIEETAPFTAAYKPNIAYFEAMGPDGYRALERVFEKIPADIPTVLDAKRGDIGETQKYYAKACFERWGADSVSLSPYLGAETLDPVLEFVDRGLYLLGITSNPGSADLQTRETTEGKFVYEFVNAMTEKSEQIGLVVGLTNAAEQVLARISDVPLLIPGLGAQGGDLAALAGQNRQAPILVNASRGVLFAEPELSFAEKAERYVKQISEALGTP